MHAALVLIVSGKPPIERISPQKRTGELKPSKTPSQNTKPSAMIWFA